MDSDKVTSLVFIDFRKAFDVIDLELLLNMLYIYGATPPVAWFKSYLSERKQFISLGKTTSQKLTVKQCVPKGSNIGPVLFLLFVNDMAPPRRKVNYGDIKTDNAETEQVANRKRLGLIIDVDLTYEVYVDKLCNKLSKRLGLLCYMSPYLKKRQRIIYFNAVLN